MGHEFASSALNVILNNAVINRKLLTLIIITLNH